MTNFQQLDNLPILDLNEELNVLLKNNVIKWNTDNQICLNSTVNNLDDFHFGTGSLTHNWDNKEIVIDDVGNEKIKVSELTNRLKEEDFSVLCSAFKNTEFEIVYNKLKQHYKLGRVRLMKSKPKTCLSWHTDSNIRIHYPIKTQPGCFMVIDNEVKHLPQYTWWLTNTFPFHTAVNASKEDRIHLVAVVLP